ncbi:Leucine-rich repeat domain, L domain-like [Phytophthora cactorum]|nr:Leucine-rich repeat domain, L domain-like [Phytophthora cactorum]
MRQGAQSLVELSVVAVALFTPVQELLEYVEFLPIAIRHQLFRELSNFRLREMEVAWEAAAKQEPPEPRDGFDPQAGDKFLFDRETQRLWEHRMNAARLGYEPIPIENTAAAQGRRRNTRNVFWEHQFRTLLKLRTPLEIAGPVDVLVECQKLFADVVEVLKVHGREVCEDNVNLILAFDSCGDWRCTTQSSKIHPQHVSEAKPDVGQEAGYLRIMTLELVSVKIHHEGFRQLVGLVTDMPQLIQLRLSNTITDFDTKLLIDAAFHAPMLQRLFLEHNELEDDAFIGLFKIRKPLALRHLRLSDNDVVVHNREGYL